MMRRPNPADTQRRGHPADQVLARAELALRMQRPAEAAQLAESVLKSNRGHAVAATILGHALLAQNRATDAVAHLQPIARRLQDAAIETLLAAALAAAGRDSDALDQLQRITSRDVGYPPAFHEHVGRLAALGRIEEAIAVATRGVALSPEAAELRLDLAALHLRRNERKTALATLTAAAEADPGRSDVLAELARTLLLEGDCAAAADTYRRALGLNPDDAMTRANYGVCQLEAGNREGGEKSLRLAVRGRPQMLGRAIHSLAASSHGRFFLRPSAAARFLNDA